MLVLSRKHGESLEIDDQVTVTVVKIAGNHVRLGIEAPRHIVVRRREIGGPAKPAPADPLHPLRILVVDDSPEDRDAYRRLIQTDADRPYEVAETDCGEEGLKWCRLRPPDCVLLDYRLPDLDGLEFLSELSGLSRPLSVPVVMLTGHGDESVAVQAIKRGAQNYLPKNRLTGEMLRGAVRDAIASAGTASARTSGRASPARA